LGPIWDQFGTNLGPIWSQFGVNAAEESVDIKAILRWRQGYF